jgi:hypothetical protein
MGSSAIDAITPARPTWFQRFLLPEFASPPSNLPQQTVTGCESEVLSDD